MNWLLLNTLITVGGLFAIVVLFFYYSLLLFSCRVHCSFSCNDLYPKQPAWHETPSRGTCFAPLWHLGWFFPSQVSHAQLFSWLITGLFDVTKSLLQNDRCVLPRPGAEGFRVPKKGLKPFNETQGALLARRLGGSQPASALLKTEQFGVSWWKSVSGESNCIISITKLPA